MTAIKKFSLIYRVMETLNSMQDMDDRISSIFLRHLQLNDNGFEVLRLENGYIVFSVPEQDSKQWFFGTTSHESKLTGKKCSLALDIKEQFGLVFCEAHDHLDSTELEKEMPHRQAAFYTRQELLVACAHPTYLKIIIKDVPNQIDVTQLFSEIRKFYL